MKEQDIILTDEEKQEIEKHNIEYKKHKKRKHAEMAALQALPFEVKLAKAKARIEEFINECDDRGLNYHISVGGLDSIVLTYLIRNMGYGPDRVPAVSVSGLEDASIIRIHKQMGVIMLKPLASKEQVIEQYGWPVLSKKTTNKIEMLQKSTPESETTRHAILTGECGRQGHFSKNSRMKLAQKWLDLFGGWDEEGKALGYSHPNFLVSDKCCYYLKEKPCDIWAKEHNSVPFLGLMASEGGRRAEALEEHGCNYFGKTVIRSAPFSPWFSDDVLRLAEELNVPIPEIYGKVVIDENGKRRTTKAQRTGCHICGFGIQMEKRPHRFDRLYERSPKLWEKTMFNLAKDLDGNMIGWGDVLDYVGVEWRSPEDYLMELRQTSIYDFIS